VRTEVHSSSGDVSPGLTLPRSQALWIGEIGLIRAVGCGVLSVLAIPLVLRGYFFHLQPRGDNFRGEGDIAHVRDGGREVSGKELDPFLAGLQIVHEIVQGIVHGFVHV
jgi:hypothetical protein